MQKKQIKTKSIGDALWMFMGNVYLYYHEVDKNEFCLLRNIGEMV